MVMVEQQHKFITGTKLYTYMAIIGKCICVCVRMHACVYFFFHVEQKHCRHSVTCVLTVSTKILLHSLLLPWLTTLRGADYTT